MAEKSKKTREKLVKPMRTGNNGGKLKSGNIIGVGRPEGSLGKKNIYQTLLDMAAPEELLKEIKKINPNAKSLRDIHAVSTFNRSLKGNAKAMELVNYYDIGKPEESVVANVTTTNIDMSPEEKKEFIRKYLNDKRSS